MLDLRHFELFFVPICRKILPVVQIKQIHLLIENKVPGKLFDNPVNFFIVKPFVTQINSIFSNRE